MHDRTIPFNTKATVTVLASSAVVAAIVATMAIAMPQGNKSSQSMAPQESSMQSSKESQAAADLRVGLNSLLQDHVTTNINVNRLIATNASEAEISAAVQLQTENSDALTAAITSIYGADAGAKFSEMFLEHITESNAFAMAVAAGDEEAKVAANAELNEYLVEIATFFSTAIPVLSYDAVYGLLLEHESLINQSTEALIAKNFGQSKKLEREALRQVSVIADALASGIIQTQPDKF